MVDQRANYQKMNFGEFTECLLRLTLLLFQHSEMEHLSLSQKLLFSLKEMLWVVQEPLNVVPP